MTQQDTKTPEKVVHMPEPDAPPGRLKPVGGSKVDDFNNYLANSVINALPCGADDVASDRDIQAALAALVGMKPESELEGMLIGQMVACHVTAMDCFRRAKWTNQTFAGRQQNLSFATKLIRAFALHLETLDRHRGKGQQKMTVEHVHVHDGGQAIVGTVNQREVGGGSEKPEDQAHGKAIAHAPEQEMRSPLEAEREAVPQRRDEKR